MFQLLGVLLFFDKGLLAMGNVCAFCSIDVMRLHSCIHNRVLLQVLFLTGVVLIIGFAKTYRFFFQKRKAKGTACFLGGIGIVLYGWPVAGMCIECWGFLNLFGDFFPMALGVCRQMPVIGTILNLPPVRALTERFISKSRLPI